MIGNDEALDGGLINATAGEEFTNFYKAWRAPIRRSLALTLGDVGLSDEAIDEAFTRALANWDKIREYERPEGWLYRVGLNWARGVFRRSKYDLLPDLEAAVDPTHDPVPDYDLIEAIAQLSVKLRSVVVARYYLDFSTREVAEALGIPAGTVKSRLARALDRLGRDLGGQS